jgi:hypothetical protein
MELDHDQARTHPDVAADAAPRVVNVLAAGEAGAATILERANRGAAVVRGRALGEATAILAAAVDRLNEQAADLARQIDGVRRQCDALAGQVGGLPGGADALAAALATADLSAAAVGPSQPTAAPLPHVAASTGNGGHAAAGREAPATPGPELTPEPERDAGRDGTRGSAAGEGDLQRTARLIALPMAVAGTPRAEVERHLRDSLGLDDPTAVLDHVFGRTARRD